MNRILFAFVCICAVRAECRPRSQSGMPGLSRSVRPAIAKGTVVLRNGLIEAVGAEIQIPSDAWVIEGEGLTVYPGLIDALSSTGMPDAAPAGGARGAAAAIPVSTTPSAAPARGPEDRPNTTSWLRAADLVKPTEKRVASARDAGFTTAVAFPMHGIFAGQGAVIDLEGENAGEMVVVPDAGQYVTLASTGFTGGYPGSLMGVFAYIRQIYIDADYYQMVKAAYAKDPHSVARPAYDRALEGVIESPRVLFPVNRRMDIDRMLRFSAELKLNPVLYGPVEGYRSADLLKGSGVPVLLNLKWPEKGKDGDPEDADTMRALEIRAHAPGTTQRCLRRAASSSLFILVVWRSERMSGRA